MVVGVGYGGYRRLFSLKNGKLLDRESERIAEFEPRSPENYIPRFLKLANTTLNLAYTEPRRILLFKFSSGESPRYSYGTEIYRNTKRKWSSLRRA